MLDYPYFVDVRDSGMADLPVFDGLPQLTIPWASPIVLSDAAKKTLEVTPLLTSSEGSWTSTDTNVIPKYDDQGLSAFAPQGEQASQMIAVGLRGRFESFFKGKPSPLLTAAAQAEAAPDAGNAPDKADKADKDANKPVYGSVIEHSPESARLFVFASNGFLSDQTLRMVGAADGTFYGNTVQMMANLIDWSLEDESLTGIRARGNFNRTLPPMEEGERSTLELLSYGLALFGVLIVYLVYRQLRRRKQREVLAWMQGGAA